VASETIRTQSVQKEAQALKERILKSVIDVVLDQAARRERGDQWDVKINVDKVKEKAAELAPKKMEFPTWTLPPFLTRADKLAERQVADEEIIDFMMIGNSINFSYTNIESKCKFATSFGTDKEGKPAVWEGAMAMWASLKRAAQENPSVLGGEFLANLTLDQAGKIFNGHLHLSEEEARKREITSEIPLLEQRVAVLREVGAELVRNYDGHFYKLITESNGRLFNNGEGLVERLLAAFPSFTDESDYSGTKVILDKRVQLAAAMLHEKLLELGKPGFSDATSELTVFVNYELPKILRAFGILEYSPELAQKVDSQAEIIYGSRSEVAIRASTLYAIQYLENEVRNINPESNVSPLHLDFELWFSGRKLDKKVHKHHLTRTIAY